MIDIDMLGKKVDLDEGHWVDEIPDNPGLRLKVRSVNYKPYKVAVAGLSRRSGKSLQTDAGLLDFTVAQGKPLAEHILLDWDGVTSGGKPLAYAKKYAENILTADDDLGIGMKFRAAVSWAAEQVADRLASDVEAIAGN